MNKKLPSIQFYPGDWLRDSVSGCSLAAQGLWLRLMMLMHDSKNYGYLTITGKPVAEEFLARKCGIDLTSFKELFSELEIAGVPSRNAKGIVFSRRMVRDAATRRAKSLAGKSGGGNPNFKKGQTNPYYHDKDKDKQEINKAHKQKIDASPSSSPSSSNLKVLKVATSREIPEKHKPIAKAIQGCKPICKTNPAATVEALKPLLNVHREVIWAAIVQSRKAENPEGYLYSLMTEAKHPIADWALEQAKKEIRSLGVV